MNPFLQNFKLSLVKVYKTYYETKTENISDGYIGKYKEVTESFLMDSQKKTAVYHIPYIENVLFSEMKSNGRDLLLYVIYNIKEEEDFINLKLDRVCQQMKTSRPSLIKGINELSDVGVIAKKSQSEYWVNPHFIFKGNRIEHYYKNSPDSVVIVAETTKGIKNEA
jgi:hypothetical protein